MLRNRAVSDAARALIRVDVLCLTGVNDVRVTVFPSRGNTVCYSTLGSIIAYRVPAGCKHPCGNTVWYAPLNGKGIIEAAVFALIVDGQLKVGVSRALTPPP